MDEIKDIPYVVYESTVARFERIIKRLVIALIVVALINVVWIYAWMQYDYSGEEITVEGTDGIANYIGGSGGIINGKSSGAEK